MLFDESKYREGYSIGVGGIVICEDKVLLVRRNRGEDIGEWAIPGGFVEKREKTDVAILREIEEETGIKAKVNGIVAVRNRIYKDENSIYLIFLLEAKSEDIKIQESEVDNVKFFDLEQINGISNLQTLSKIVIKRFLRKENKVLLPLSQNDFAKEEYSIFG